MKRLFKTLLIGASLITGLTPVLSKSANYHKLERHVYNDIKKPQAKTHTFQIGGIPLVTEYYGSIPGLTPKEYGMLYGNGKSKKYKTNKRHRSFRAKLKRSPY